MRAGAADQAGGELLALMVDDDGTAEHGRAVQACLAGEVAAGSAEVTGRPALSRGPLAVEHAEEPRIAVSVLGARLSLLTKG